MGRSELAESIRMHEDADLFRDAVNFTAAKTHFLPRLIEKDYFCTILLDYLTTSVDGLVFKGGTCLAKVHAGFYRLSEDLDFVIPMPVDASRSSRSARATRVKKAIADLSQKLSFFQVIEPLVGANNSTQYIASVGYSSVIGQRKEVIKIEIGLREPLLTPVFEGLAQTILLNPVSGTPIVNTLQVPSISRSEAMAEKLRAALSRREPAIRDFYDVDYAVRKMGLQLSDAKLIALVRQKLSVPGNEAVDVSGDRLAALKQQIDTQLKPVLRKEDFEEFHLNHAFAMVVGVADRVG